MGPCAGSRWAACSIAAVRRADGPSGDGGVESLRPPIVERQHADLIARTDGHYFGPFVFADVAPDASILRSEIAAPILHRAGEVARESKGTSHWWQNTGKSAVELISVDILPPQMKTDDKMM